MSTIKTWQERIPESVKVIGTACSQKDYMLAEIADLRAALAATEASKEVTPYGWLDGIDIHGCETVYFNRDRAQRECDEYNAFMREQPKFTEGDLRYPIPVYTILATKGTAP